MTSHNVTLHFVLHNITAQIIPGGNQETIMEMILGHSDQLYIRLTRIGMSVFEAIFYPGNGSEVKFVAVPFNIE